MAKGTLSNKLIGRLVERNIEMPHHPSAEGKGGHHCERCGDIWATRSCWPFDQEPNLVGQYLATIEAAWVEDGVVKVLLRSVMSGKVAEAWMSHLILREEVR